MTIPLWLDLGGLRVVHACWSSKHIDYLQRLVGENDTLTEELGVEASTKGSQLAIKPWGGLGSGPAFGGVGDVE